MTKEGTTSANRFRFRAWHKNAMHDVDWLILLGEKPAVMLHGVDKQSNDDFVLLQSTGLTDKNGKEIFEGDVVKAPIGGNRIVKFGEWSRERTHKGDTQGQHYGWYVEAADKIQKCLMDEQYRPDSLLHWHKMDWFTVIGNIYENPTILPS